MSVKLRSPELLERSVGTSASPGLMGGKVTLVILGGRAEENGSLAEITSTVGVKIAIHH